MELDFGQYCVVHSCQRKKKSNGVEREGRVICNGQMNHQIAFALTWHDPEKVLGLEA